MLNFTATINAIISFILVISLIIGLKQNKVYFRFAVNEVQV